MQRSVLAVAMASVCPCVCAYRLQT